MKIGKKRKKPRPQGQQPEELEKNQDPSKENKETEEDTEETEEDSPTESLPPAAPEGTAPEAEKEVTKGNKNYKLKLFQNGFSHLFLVRVLSCDWKQN